MFGKVRGQIMKGSYLISYFITIHHTTVPCCEIDSALHCVQTFNIKHVVYCMSASTVLALPYEMVSTNTEVAREKVDYIGRIMAFPDTL